MSNQQASGDLTSGYNVLTGEYGSMLAQGVVDPVKVTRSAVQNAVSIAGLLLTTEALIADLLLSRDEILDQLWCVDYVAESNVVDRHIHNLRVKLQNGWQNPRYIATIPGRGYHFVATAAEDPSAA